MLTEIHRPNIRRCVTALLSCALLAQGCATAPGAAESHKLIDQLIEVSRPVDGANPGLSTGDRDLFMALNEEPPAFGTALYSNPEVMRRLVQLGLVALPALLDHLQDARPTKLHITRTPIFHDAFFGDEYDPRAALPPNSTSMAAKLVQFSHHPVANGEYTVRVGDLCYVLIGQIVNRNLTAVRSEGVSVIINSPVETPALAAAVRQDWAHLTPDEHALSLVQDIDLHHGNVALTYARLCYYYPKAGEKPVLEVLDRLPTSYKGIRAFLIQNVLSSDDPQIWERRLNEVGGTWGSVNLNLYIARLKAWTKYRPDDLPEISPTGPALSPWSLQDIFFTRRIHGTTGGGFLIEETLRQPEWDRARQIIQLWTNAAASHGNLNQEVRTEEVNIQAAVLEGLNDYVNPYVDEATYKLFVRAKSANHMQIIDDTSMDHLALVCANRLAGKGHDADFRDYFEKRLLQLTDYSSQTRSWVARINQVLAKLKPAETAEK